MILLDGLDEVADQATRRRLIEAVEALYLDPRPGLAGNLCLLTTRPHGFSNLSLGAGFQTVTVRPFGRDDVFDFIGNWYRVAYGEEALAEEAAELIAAIRNNERVEALASNPLLCTIIAVVYRNNRVLPERRVELYLKCCEALLDTWERNKDIRSSGLIGSLSWQEKLELLANLAYWMHGETERLAASEDLVVEQITAAIEADKLADSGKAADEARRFIEIIRDRSGILQGRGDGLLEFSHRTFQEYLTARHLAAMGDEEMIDAVMRHLHEAWWQEVHLLLFGHLGSSKEGSRRVERLALCILDAVKSPLWFLLLPRNRWLRYASPGRWFPGWQLQARVAWLLGRDLTVAVLGYGQCTATARPNGLTDRLKQEINTFISRWRRRPRLMSAALENLCNAVRQGARDGPIRDVLRADLLAALEDSDSSVQWAAAEALGSAASSDPAVVAPLLAALKDSNSSGRWAAARALGSAASGDPAVVAALLAALKDSDSNVGSAAAEALGSAASGDPAVVAPLLAALKDSDSSGRWAAARALGSAASGDPAVVAALLAALKDSDSSVRSAVAGALGSAASGDPAVVAALLAALKDSDSSVRWAAAEALGSAASGDPAVVAPLLAALKDSDSSVRWAAAEALGSAASSDPAVVAALLAALKDSDSNVRWAAARALGSAASGDPSVAAALLAALIGLPEISVFLIRRSLDEIFKVTEGRRLPGYRWRPLAERRRWRGRLRKLGVAAATGLAIGAALYFGGEWFAGLPDADPTKNFLKAVPAISTVLGIVWGLVLVIRGEKRTIWG